MTRALPARDAPEEIDAYLAALPEEMRDALQQVREIIRKHIPACTERVSYGIPIFRLRSDLVGISAQKKHCSLHTMSPGLIKRIRQELANFEISGATIHFQPTNPIPRELLRRIIDERIGESSHTV